MTKLHYVWGIPVMIIFGLFYLIVNKDEQEEVIDTL